MASVLPVRAWPFPVGAFGFSLPIVRGGFEPATTPLFGLLFSSKLYIYPTTGPACACQSTSPGVPSPTALDRIRRPYTRWIQPPAPYVLRVSHPLDVLLRPKPCGACFIPTAPLGFSRTSLPRVNLAVQQGQRARVCLSTAFSSPVTNRCWPVLPSCVRRADPSNPFGERREANDEHCTVSITEESVFSQVANLGHQPS